MSTKGQSYVYVSLTFNKRIPSNNLLVYVAFIHGWGRGQERVGWRRGRGGSVIARTKLLNEIKIK